MPWRDAAPGLFIQRLIGVEPYTVYSQQLGCDLRQATSEYQLLNGRAAPPEVLDLQERFAICVPLFEGQMHGVQLDYFPSDLRLVVAYQVLAQHRRQPYETVCLQQVRRISRQLIGT